MLEYKRAWELVKEINKNCTTAHQYMRSFYFQHDFLGSPKSSRLNWDSLTGGRTWLKSKAYKFQSLIHRVEISHNV